MASQAATTPYRTAPRFVTDIKAMWSSCGQRGDAVVYNISTGGCMIESADDRWFEGDALALTMPQIPPLEGWVVWQNGRYAGIQFRQPLDAATVGELGFDESETSFGQTLPRDRFGRMLPILSGRLPF